MTMRVTAATQLAALIRRPKLVVAPGVYDFFVEIVNGVPNALVTITAV